MRVAHPTEIQSNQRHLKMLNLKVLNKSPIKSQSVHATRLEWFIYIVRVDWQQGNCVEASESYFNYNTRDC